ncbi:MAG TPA: hypothetical protein VK586_12455 [Streptosporangiaceae bacterium]|nr:hypothetical protein [Streptosporangiaceae bacterium]
MLVEELGRGVEQRAAGGQARRVHQAVDPAVGGDHCGGAGLRLHDVGDVGADEHRSGAACPEGRRQRLAGLRSASGDRHRRALGGGGAGDGRPDFLSTATDQDDLAVEQCLHGLSPSAVDEGAAAAIDQQGSWLDGTEEAAVDQVPGGLGERRVQADDVAAGGEVAQAGAADVIRRDGDWIVGEHPHPERPGQLADPLPDAAVADDADRGAFQVPDGNLMPLGPPAAADQVGQWPEPLGQVQGHAEDRLGDGAGSAAGGDDDGDAALGRGGDVDQVDPDACAGQDAKVRHAPEQRPVHQRVSPHDSARGRSQVTGLRAGDEGGPARSGSATSAGSTVPRPTTIAAPAARASRSVTGRPAG